MDYTKAAYVRKGRNGLPVGYEHSCKKYGLPIIYYRKKTQYAEVEMDLIFVPNHYDKARTNEFQVKIKDLFREAGIKEPRYGYGYIGGTFTHTRRCPIGTAEKLAQGLLEMYKQTFEQSGMAV